MKAPSEEIYGKSRNQRKEHNVDSTLNGLQLCRLQYGSIFIRLALPPKSAKPAKFSENSNL